MTADDEQTGLSSFGSSAGCTSNYPQCYADSVYFEEWIDARL